MQSKCLFTLLLLALLGYSSCTFNFEDDTWNPEYAFPLVNTQLSLDDVLNSFSTGGFLQVDGDKFLTVVYESENGVLNTDTIELVALPDFTFPVVQNNQVSPSPFSGGEASLDFFRLLDGQLKIRFESNVAEAITVVITLPKITKNGEPLTHTINVPNPNGITPLQVEDSIRIDGYEFDLSDATFTIGYTATVDSDGQATTPSNFFLDFKDLEHEYIEGYFGMNSFQLPTYDISLDVFDSWRGGTLNFVDPKLAITFVNSFGFPVRVNADTFKVMTKLAGEMDLIVTDYPDGVDLPYPGLDEVGQAKSKTIFVNAQNSNFNQIISQAPYGIKVNFGGVANPERDSTLTQFANNFSEIKAFINAELPIHGTAKNFMIQDTLDLNLSDVPEGKAEFKLVTINGFPWDLGLQAYFLDANDNIIDSLFTTADIFASAPIDNDGRVTGPTTVEKFILFAKTRVEYLKTNGQKMVLVTTFNTIDGGNTPVKIYSDYDVTFKIGVIASNE